MPGYGSVASPAKEEKIASNKNDERPMKLSPSSESTQEMVDGRKMFESWLFDKLPFITAMELQVIGNRLIPLEACGLFQLFHLACDGLHHHKHSRNICSSHGLSAFTVIHYPGRAQECCTIPAREAHHSRHHNQRHRSELLCTILKNH